MITEKDAWAMNGYLGIFVIVVLLSCSFLSIVNNQITVGIIFLIIGIILMTGLTLIQPNEAKVVLFFGHYVGSIRKEGLVITVPFSHRRKISLRIHNFHTNRLKVNDINGNPLEIAAVIVYKVVDTAKAVFDVEQYERFVATQSETALRTVATKYPYDSLDETELTLRGNVEEISKELQTEAHDRLYIAGVDVCETRLTHLAYSTEIAQAMLQRQQASAIIDARKQIVAGAVGMVQEAIKKLEEQNDIKLDDEKKMSMMNNLLVAIVAEQGVQSIITTDSLSK